MNTRQLNDMFQKANDNLKPILVSLSLAEITQGIYLLATADNMYTGFLGAAFAGGGLKAGMYSLQKPAKDLTLGEYLMNTACGAASKIINGLFTFYTKNLDLRYRVVLNSVGGFVAEFTSEAIESLYEGKNKFRKNDLIECTLFGGLFATTNHKLAPHAKLMIVEGDTLKNLLKLGFVGALSGGVSGVGAKAVVNLIEGKDIKNKIDEAASLNIANCAVAGAIDGYRIK